MKKATKAEILQIKNILIKNYKDAKTELEYRNFYELLVAIMLSAQCTDKRVNIITPALFKAYPDVYALANANLDDIKALIKSCSFFNNKASNLLKMANQIVGEFNGEFPKTQKELVSLAGVGQKTANVALIESENRNLMAVDTHVFRTAHRLGLSKAKSVEQTEKDLVSAFKDELHVLHQAMVLFGRYICKSKNPDCEACFLKDFCKSKEGFKP